MRHGNKQGILHFKIIAVINSRNLHFFVLENQSSILTIRI